MMPIYTKEDYLQELKFLQNLGVEVSEDTIKQYFKDNFGIELKRPCTQVERAWIRFQIVWRKALSSHENKL